MPLTLLNSFDKYKRIVDLVSNEQGPISVFGLGEAHKAHIISGLFFDTKKTILYCLPTDSDCIKFEESLKAYSTPVLHFPSKSLTFDNVYAFGGTTRKRIEVLMQIVSGFNCVVLVSAETLMQKLAPKDALVNSRIELKAGESYDLYQLISRLVAAGYSRSDVCETKGQFAVRGGRLDVYPINYDLPYRIEFWDDEIDTMRTFDIDSQRSIENVELCMVYPYSEVPISDEVRSNTAKKLLRIDKKLAQGFERNDISGEISRFLPLMYENESSILDYLPKDRIIFLDEPARLVDSLRAEYEIFVASVESVLEQSPNHTFLWKLLFTPSEAIGLIDSGRTIMFFMFTQTFNQIRPKELIQFDARNMTSYHNNENMLYSDLISYRHSGYRVMIFAGEYAKHLHSNLTSNGIYASYSEVPKVSDNECVIIPRSLPQGFEYREYRFAVITEAELYSQSYKKPVSKASKKSAAERLTVDTLNVGDYIVHEVHGIGKYLGVETITADSKTRDYIVLQYHLSDKLYIPTDQLDKVQKYMGADDGATPTLSRLGSGEWQRTVSRVSNSVKALAFDLIQLYAERINKKGYAYSSDTVWQRELENSFPYEETPDQLTAAEEIKEDMESPKIMDRLLCGDVGFGKTEVALRMAFKAAQDSKQVALLVPTTILAHQHYNTLKTRFMGFPITVDYISRFKTKKEQDETLKRLKDGSIDILVGTHRMLSKDVKFKDLGLLIIDEEQRFGVGHKEQIKELKKSVDVLALTATPIPRTLHMSLIGIRDGSVTETPPETR
ncbi:MAG: DEAD/DEAH box helicase [Clostridiales bacterium]|nr:DEAD/DEAH box helicase [Clostridiales bacterium]